MLHVQHAAKQGHNQILVHTVDTNVVVLTVMVTKMLSVNIELWLAFGTGNTFDTWLHTK